MPLQVKAAYNGQDKFFCYRWPSERPGINHDMLKFEGGKWGWAMDTGNLLEDKAMVGKRVYTEAFAVHRNATGSRWHYVSLPFSHGLDREAEFSTVRFDGAEHIEEGVPLKARHSEKQLALFGVEMAFNEETQRQWLFTLLAGLDPSLKRPGPRSYAQRKQL